ncbi:MAG TPA: HD domain-containing phosphohydrolase [Anaerolineales bacterium]|nr:HD domain-containing phosphohydrolase [Anaerolineales bacterium]
MAGEKILLVEDNDVLREGLRSLLEQEKFVLQVAGNGLEALDAMRAITPDLILSDILMPEMDGHALFEAVRSRPEWISIPFIFLTARREREYILAGKKLGADDYLLKPVSPEDLLTAIRSRLGRSQQLLLAQLQESYEASLIMLANAIELRDAYTRGHVERVMNYAQAIAEQLAWPVGSKNQLRYGSILHDIGKIHIAEEILSKDGPLDPDEWFEMRKHPELGAELIRGIHYLEPAIPVILYHHERWNGCGYPFGLKEESIPVAARIVAIADSFDAMTTARPYRKALSPREACEEILAGSGSQYDPEIVRAFERVWGEQTIQAIYEAFP